jgi:hypothetical protein
VPSVSRVRYDGGLAKKGDVPQPARRNVTAGDDAARDFAPSLPKKERSVDADSEPFAEPNARDEVG